VGRRQLLAELCTAVPVPGVVFSSGVVGPGRAFYQAVVAAGHEGVMAKLLTAPYRPGRRALSWRKIKPGGPRHRIQCGATPPRSGGVQRRWGGRPPACAGP
jgi:ATP-dependent DNA ligase